MNWLKKIWDEIQDQRAYIKANSCFCGHMNLLHHRGTGPCGVVDVGMTIDVPCPCREFLEP